MGLGRVWRRVGSKQAREDNAISIAIPTIVAQSYCMWEGTGEKLDKDSSKILQKTKTAGESMMQLGR